MVYDDRNGDGAYTAGEGLGGVVLRALRVADGGTAETTTASAGGYGLPLPPATYEVTATLADGRQSTQSLTLADRNVKTDFRAADFVVPRQCGLGKMGTFPVFAQVPAFLHREKGTTGKGDIHDKYSQGKTEISHNLQGLSHR